MDKLKMQTENIVDENIEFLGKRFPNVIVEARDENGKLTKMVDFDALKQELSNVVVDGDKERYVMTWPDKKKAKLTASAPISKTLRPCKEESVGKDGTAGGFDSENIYIEGDNLDVLKVLRETYLGKIKMIYIDPPYNTGNDFVYNDNFVISTEDYLERSNQVDEEGYRMSPNTESNGRFHTDWLNMIYPRLKLAKDLLTEDGVIFISIDDNEQANLKKICDEIFGASNFIAVFPRLTTKSGKTPLTYMVSHDYVICYVKNRKEIFIGKEYSDQSYKYEDEFVDERGRYNLKQPLDCNSISYSKSLDYPIEHEGKTYYPGGDYNKYLERKKGNYLQKDYAWRWSKDLYEFGLKNGWIVFSNGRIYTKGYLNATIEKNLDGKYKIQYREKTRKLSTIDFINNEYSNDIAKKQLLSYKLDQKFDYPKPYNLIMDLIASYYDKNALILDFFGGSSTTAESIVRQNIIDGGNRRFIIIQLPEKIDNSESSICDLGKERIRRAGKKIKQETNADIDYGFRVFKLDSSNMKDTYYKPREYSENLLDALEENIKSDRTAEDLLFQVMLDLGLMLDSKIEQKCINGKKVFVVGEYNETLSPDLICCFDSIADDKTVIEIAKLKPRYAVFRDSSLGTDTVAVNFDQIFKFYSPSTTRKVL